MEWYYYFPLLPSATMSVAHKSSLVIPKKRLLLQRWRSTQAETLIRFFPERQLIHPCQCWLTIDISTKTEELVLKDSHTAAALLRAATRLSCMRNSAITCMHVGLPISQTAGAHVHLYKTRNWDLKPQISFQNKQEQTKLQTCGTVRSSNGENLTLDLFKVLQ